MANGRNKNTDPLMALLSNPGNQNLIPMTRDTTREGTKVVDLTKRRGKTGVAPKGPTGGAGGANDRGTLFNFLDKSVGSVGRGAANIAYGSGELVSALVNEVSNQQTQPQVSQRPNMGVGSDGIPNSLRRRKIPQEEQDPVVQALSGGMDKYERATQRLGEEFGTTVENQNLGTDAEGTASDFAGRMIEGTTPRGMPEAEELGGLGKALSSFSKALETPGFQRFLSEMGIAFSGGREGAPGTVLGQANINQLDADAEAEVMQRLLAGESLEDIDMSMMSNPESVRAATQVAGQQQELSMAQEGQEFDQEFQLERLDQFDQQLGIQRDRLDLDWFKAISDRMQTEAGLSKPDDVSSFEHGYALDAVASSDMFYKTAVASLDARAEELGLKSIKDIQAVLRGDDGQRDPMAIREQLSPEMQREFDRQVNQLAQSQARSYRDINNPTDLDFIPGIVSPTSREEAESLPVGTLMKLPNGETGIKTATGYRPVNIPYPLDQNQSEE